MENMKVSTKVYTLSVLRLSNFRNYGHTSLQVNNTPAIITGHNGAGKTNILEAISFLSPGRGLRSIKLSKVDNQAIVNVDSGKPLYSNGNLVNTVSNPQPWGVSAEINFAEENYIIGTGRVEGSQGERDKRVVKVDGEVLRNNNMLTHHFSVLWLVPQMDQLFLDSASVRRKFLDRLIYNFAPEHAKRVSRYERFMRERAKLLQQYRNDPYWLDSLEQQMAENAVAIAVARCEGVEHINHAIEKGSVCFPRALLTIDGDLEQRVGSSSALEIEEYFKAALRENRGMDKERGKTHLGVHRSDLVVFHVEKNMPAALCSTGEQKSLLLSIIMAEVRAKSMWKHEVPVLLLDEVIAHLDTTRREALFQEILELGAQVWMTGTDRALFDGLQKHAQCFEVENGQVTKQAE